MNTIFALTLIALTVCYFVIAHKNSVIVDKYTRLIKVEQKNEEAFLRATKRHSIYLILERGFVPLIAILGIIAMFT